MLNEYKIFVEGTEYYVKNELPEIKFNQEHNAYYMYSDTIYCEFGEDASSWTDLEYFVFFHELIHSTGNRYRLDRLWFHDESTPRGVYLSQSLREELLADLGAAYLCKAFGIECDLEGVVDSTVWYWNTNFDSSWLISEFFHDATKAVMYYKELVV